ncbi:MAG: thioredoxin domain-containing protein [Planctomycetota bacterium]
MKEGEQEILEVAKACEELKPILLYFHKAPTFDEGDRKDSEADACEKLQENVWKQWVITELAREFVCIRVDKSKADPKMLRRHRCVRAPVIRILDFKLEQIHFSASPKVKFKSLAKTMDSARTKVEKAVKKLAGGEGTDPLIEKAKSRMAVIEQRKVYDKGLTQLARRNWSGAKKEFNKVLAMKPESEWTKQANAGLVEVDAGKLFVKAEALAKGKRWQQAKECLDKIIGDYKEAIYFGELAKNLMKKVAPKVKD